ncbi:MAG: long-chain fatty acid--CoA ligase [Nitrospirae bacterium]|nr:long-chain fatty acid--CoA ligase [Nitrospirota bacterium]
MDLGRMLAESSQRYSENIALICGEKKLTYRALNQEANRLAHGLIHLGIKPGDRVAVLLNNSPEFVISYFAILKAGASVVPLNTMFKEGELKYILSNSRSRLVLTLSSFREILNKISPALPHLKHKVIFDKRWLLRDVSYVGLKKGQPINEPALDRGKEADDVAAILYTSGTTGRSKGAMLTHNNLLSNVASIKEAFKSVSPEVMLCVLPLFHAFAATVNMLFPFSFGSTMVIMKGFVAGDVLRAIAEHRVTIFSGVPPMYAVLANISPAKYNISSWRLAISGGAALPVEVMHAFESKYKVLIYEGDGPTECSPVTSVNPIGGKRKPGSIGLPVPGVEMKIVDEEGKYLPPEKIGEIVVRGPNVMKGYLNQPEATAEAIKDGWFHTGDIGKKDRDGYFYILDRKKDMVNVAGFNVYPREIEDVLYTHPKIAEAAVVGVLHDGLRGEVPKAFVVLREGEEMSREEVISYCQSKIANYKVPRYVEFRKDFPRTPIGKVLKRALR